MITLLYYGLTLSADKIHLTEDTYTRSVFLILLLLLHFLPSFIAISLIELPSSLLLIPSMDICGRKPLLVLALLIPGASCIAAGLLQEGAVFTLCVLLGTSCPPALLPSCPFQASCVQPLASTCSTSPPQSSTPPVSGHYC